MNFQMYANNRRTHNKPKNNNVKEYTPKMTPNKKRVIDDDILNLRVSVLMDRYKEDPEVIANIRGEINIFLLNLTVAREVHAKDQERKLKKEFSNYLKKLEKEI